MWFIKVSQPGPTYFDELQSKVAIEDRRRAFVSKQSFKEIKLQLAGSQSLHKKLCFFPSAQIEKGAGFQHF